MTTAVIIQARMGSTRLPGKVMKCLCGMPVLWHIIHRVKAAHLPQVVIVVTTVRKMDDVIEQSCRLWDTPCFRGDEDDVLKRYYDAVAYLESQGFSIDYIVRITADCPMIDPTLIDRAIGLAKSGGYDYVSNTQPPTFPDGLDVEVMSRNALELAHRKATKRLEREHVTPYIFENKRFLRKNFINSTDLSSTTTDFSFMRWTLDKEEDFIFIREIYNHLFLNKNIFLMDDVLKLLKEHPELEFIRSNTKRNEQYFQMIKEEHRLWGKKNEKTKFRS
jgi:spore coat polysaccharide biosynthesis protein SpsF